MKTVLDTSAIIYLQDFRKFEEVFTTSSVLNEVKDKMSGLKLSVLRISVLDPAKKSREEIKNAARKTGDLEKLSETDIDVLALAKELGITLVSDDYNIQNVAEKIGIKYISVFNKRISKFFVWRKYCPACKKYLGSELNECPTCGTALKRVPSKKVGIEK